MSTKKLHIVLLLIVFAMSTLAIHSSTLAQDDGPSQGFRLDAPPYAVHGPYSVGYMTFDNGDTDTPLTGGIWYPARNPDGLDDAIDYDIGVDFLPALSGNALLNAEPDSDNAPYPLVVNSHGGGGTIYYNAYMYEHLASLGFVVISPNHVDNFVDSIMMDPADFLPLNLDSIVLRPLDITRTLDYATDLTAPDGAMAGIIDMERIAVIGGSYGGYTALMAVGGRLDFSTIPDMCAAGANLRPWNGVCDFSAEELLALEQRLIDLAGVDIEPGELWPSLGDERIDAVVSLFPGNFSAVISDEGMAKITVPILLSRNGGDQLVPNALNADRAWQFVSSSSKLMYTLEHAAHEVMGRCSPAWNALPDFFVYCFDPVWDKNRAHDLANHFNAAFLLAILYNDADAAGVLAPDTVQIPGIQYETTGF
ncbi:MAG: hypothetical protein JXA10_13440 [Anaerolineae bacterium]|nr:hypothetical protein [Anaerolineae bacterium]